MRGLHPLDRTIGTEWPALGNDAAVRAFEATPYAERIAATNTYEALRLGAARDPDAAALLFLPNADPDETPLRISHREFFGRLTQVANMLHGLDVGPGDVVSLLLPLLPQSFCALFGAEAAGIANPVNPLLEAGQIADILRAAKTKVLIALGPLPGTDIWSKVERIRGHLPDLKAIVVVHGAADRANGIHAFDALADAQPADLAAASDGDREAEACRTESPGKHIVAQGARGKRDHARQSRGVSDRARRSELPRRAGSLRREQAGAAAPHRRMGDARHAPLHVRRPLRLRLARA